MDPQTFLPLHDQYIEAGNASPMHGCPNGLSLHERSRFIEYMADAILRSHTEIRDMLAESPLELADWEASIVASGYRDLRHAACPPEHMPHQQLLTGVAEAYTHTQGVITIGRTFARALMVHALMFSQENVDAWISDAKSYLLDMSGGESD